MYHVSPPVSRHSTDIVAVVRRCEIRDIKESLGERTGWVNDARCTVVKRFANTYPSPFVFASFARAVLPCTRDRDRDLTFPERRGSVEENRWFVRYVASARSNCNSNTERYPRSVSRYVSTCANVLSSFLLACLGKARYVATLWRECAPTTMIDLTVKTLDSQNHVFSLEDDVSASVLVLCF